MQNINILIKYFFLLPIIPSIIYFFSDRIISKKIRNIIYFTISLTILILSIYISYIFIICTNNTIFIKAFLWLSLNDINFNINFKVNNFIILMILLVSIITFCVNLYSFEYMKLEKSYNRFIILIFLFEFFMNILISSNDLLSLFFGWEGVGIISYLLIGFWNDKKKAIKAANKTLIINKFSDGFFLFGIILIIVFIKNSNFDYIINHVSILKYINISLLNSKFNLLNIICYFLLIGIFTKSAQIPFYIWLPDSMEGPTPISALIHSATMVLAGIFILIKLIILFKMYNNILNIILLFGSITAFLSSITAIIQNNIKKIIAYSTISQLGYITSSIGVCSINFSIFHLINHAFFKSLLFLIAGVIIYITKEQNIFLIKKKNFLINNFLYVLLLISILSLTAFPFFSGFYSKELILLSIFHNKSNYIAYISYKLLILSSLLTVIYSFRLFFTIFDNFSLYKKKKNSKISLEIKISLFILFIMTIFSGYLRKFLYIFNVQDKYFLHYYILHKEYYLMFFINILGILISLIYTRIELCNKNDFVNNIKKIILLNYGIDQLIYFLTKIQKILYKYIIQYIEYYFSYLMIIIYVPFYIYKYSFIIFKKNNNKLSQYITLIIFITLLVIYSNYFYYILERIL